MKIAAITNPLHAVHVPDKPIGMARGEAYHNKLDYKRMSMRALKTYLCRPGSDDGGVILCDRSCYCYDVCQFGQEYIRRLEHGL